MLISARYSQHHAPNQFMGCLLKCSALLLDCKELIIVVRLFFNSAWRDDVQIIAFQFNNNVYIADFYVPLREGHSNIKIRCYLLRQSKRL